MRQGNCYENRNLCCTDTFIFNIPRDTNESAKDSLLGNHPDLRPVSMLKSCYISFFKTKQEKDAQERQGSTAKTH